MDEQTRHDEAPEALEDLEVADAQGEEVTGGKPTPIDFVIVKKVDKSSPVLLQ